jgi:hypothetical protein
MSRNDSISSGPYYYLPVEVRDGYYVARSSRWDESLIEMEELIDDIDADFTEVEATVSIDGIFHVTTVYVSTKGKQAYVLITSDRRPAVGNLGDDVRKEDIAVYLKVLNEAVEQTESYPTQCGEYVRHVFIEPFFADLDATDSGVPRRRLSWSELFLQSRVVILGEPGMGKTTCLRALATATIDRFQNDETTRIPIYIALRHFGVDDDLTMRCDSSLAESGRYELGFDKLALSGRLLILLDGLDEMTAQARERFLMQVAQLTERHALVSMVITSRTSSYRNEFRNFRHLLLEPFDDSQMQQWIEWKLEPQESWKESSRLWKYISRDAHMHSILRTPLLLAIAAFLYRQNDSMPSSRARLLNRFVEALTGFWDEIRGIKRASHNGLNREVRLEHLQHAAFMCRALDTETFRTEQYVSWHRQLLAQVDAGAALIDIAENTGLWSKRGEDHWEFRHRTIQDFLSAKHLVESTDDILQTASEKLEDPDWNDVWVFVACLTPNASRFVESISSHPALSRANRARLLSSVLTSEINVSVTAFRTAASLLTDLLRELLTGTRSTGLLRNESDGWMMTMEFGVDTEYPELEAIQNVIGNLLRGDSSRHRLLLSDLLDESDDPQIRHIARGMRVSGTVLQRMQRTARGGSLVISRKVSE